MLVEIKLDLSFVIPESYGTADCLIYNNNELYVVDFKYGRGVLVSAKNNEQMLIYAIGCVDRFKLRPEKITLIIYQPRKSNISEWTLSIFELEKFKNDILRPTAQIAHQGKGERKKGDWCKFCKHKYNCNEFLKM